MKAYQDLPLNMFINITVDLWKDEDGIFSVTLDQARDLYPNVYYEMLDNGYHYQFLTPIRIEGSNVPIGSFAVFLDEEAYNRLITNDNKKKAFEQYAFEQAKRIELIFNAQYQRLLQNDD